MSHFFAFFDVWARISAPVARHGWRPWQIKARAWSFFLPKSWPRASHWHLQITKTRLGVVCWSFWVTFLCFFLLLLGSLVLVNASLCLELRFARVSAQEKPLAPRSDSNKVFGIFLGHLSCVRAWAWAWALGRGSWVRGVGRGACAQVRSPAACRLPLAAAAARRCLLLDYTLFLSARLVTFLSAGGVRVGVGHASVRGSAGARVSGCAGGARVSAGHARGKRSCAAECGAGARGARWCVDWESGLGIGDSGLGLGMGIAFRTWAW